ncbi:DUF5047 domain-containing protein [Labedaea rhizosphaerae]|uniref:Uncharacterized protein DUF5047 n=1 Tax=Labedaea rhizosphaerae TaxID=598644 RepID=A0A4R6SJQ5_LABRH|nr:DUF5047 domain-containing protein [Labedaea rhizosphaerae]TDQ01238.1 uncharacterized protein DUF5047 [Labedaea rhizosphaerae]
MWPLSSLAQLVLTGSHSITVRATAYTAAYGAVTMPVSSGSITCDATSQVRRTGTVGIADPVWWPADPLAVLSPLGSELAVEYGIVIPQVGTEWVPVIRGPITEVRRDRPYSSGDAALTVSVADRSSTVAEARFEQPTQTHAGATNVAEITRLITAVLPGVTVIDRTGSTQVAARLDIERERWADGIEVLTDAIGAETFADAIGNFVIRPTPTLADPVAWVIAAGADGVLVSKSDTQTRSLTYNEVVASGQRSDGTPPVYAIVADTDPTSPTYINGPFGRRPRFYTSPLLTTVTQCRTAAAGLLARTTGMQATVTLTAITNPALDAGDVIAVVQGSTRTLHIVDTVSIPLGVGEAQQITTRSLVLPAES